MNNLKNFDVLIVYAQRLAKSASDSSKANKTPFPQGSKNQSYNTVYGYFLETCRRQGLTAAFTTSADIIGPGHCKSFWQFTNDRWTKVDSPCFSTLIFDKFSPVNIGIKSRRQLLFSSPDIKSFNDPDLFDLFFDKQLTYNKLSPFAIPTISIEDRTLQGISATCKALTALLSSHPNSADFTTDIIMKDRFGAGGRHVYKFEAGEFTKMRKVVRKNPKISFIIQPFVKFDQGFSFRNCPGSTDIRFIYLNGKIVQSYIRVAKPGDFRCNEHQGGLLTYLALAQIPASLVAKSSLIAKILDKKSSLFALDFIISNNGNSYLLEGNTGPGLDWNMDLPKNETAAKKLIRLIVKELSIRSKPEESYSPPTIQDYSPIFPAQPSLSF